MLVYKYQKIDEWFYKNLTNMEIFCNLPENFNDPFDCSIDIMNKSTGSILKKRNRDFIGLTKDAIIIDKVIKKAMNEIKKKSYVSCFTTTNNDELMWAHYSNSHKGVCIEYELNEKEIEKVSYSEEYPVFSERWINGVLNINIGNREIFNEEFHLNYFQEFKEKFYLVKSKAWEYEEEWRIIQAKSIKKIDKSQIKSIYFGLNTSEEDIKIVIKLLDDLEIKIPIYKMEKVNEKFLFEPKLIKN